MFEFRKMHHPSQPSDTSSPPTGGTPLQYRPIPPSAMLTRSRSRQGLGAGRLGTMSDRHAPLIVMALFAVMRPSFWKQWISFAADSRGVYLVQVHRSEFVRIP